MQIPVKFYKVLNPPPNPSEPNAFYLVYDAASGLVEAYITDTEGVPYLYGNTAAILAIIAAAMANTTPGLLASTPVNLNEGTTAKQVQFTVPAARRAIVTRIDIDNLSAAPTIAEFTMGWNAGATDTLDPFLLADLVTTATRFGSILVQPTSWLVGTAGQSLGLAVSTPEGAALTARLNVFGYLTDTNGVPVANIL
ncbi:MAG: hypothetical protein ACT4OT_13965 [Acidobacteriota bacterium]